MLDRFLGDRREPMIQGLIGKKLGMSQIFDNTGLAHPVTVPLTVSAAGLKDIEKKLVQHLKRRQETELAQLARARALVSPNNQPQERVLTIAPFLARYGMTLITDLNEAIESWYTSTLEAALNPS